MGTPARPEARLRGGAIWSRPPYFRLPLGERLLPVRGALPGEMAAEQPLRVLALAGFRQSERGFREKTGALRKALRGRAELVCLSGPHLVSGAVGSEGAGPDSGETEMHPASSIGIRFHNSPQHTPTLYPRLIPSQTSALISLPFSQIFFCLLGHLFAHIVIPKPSVRPFLISHPLGTCLP